MTVQDLLDALKNVDPNMEVVVASDIFYNVNMAHPMFDTRPGHWEKKVFAIVTSIDKRR